MDCLEIDFRFIDNKMHNPEMAWKPERTYGFRSCKTGGNAFRSSQGHSHTSCPDTGDPETHRLTQMQPLCKRKKGKI